MSHQEHFFPERMPAVFTSSKSTVTKSDNDQSLILGVYLSVKGILSHDEISLFLLDLIHVVLSIKHLENKHNCHVIFLVLYPIAL